MRCATRNMPDTARSEMVRTLARAEVLCAGLITRPIMEELEGSAVGRQKQYCSGMPSDEDTECSLSTLS